MSVRDSDRVLRIDALAAEPGLVHGFSTLGLGGMERPNLADDVRTPARMAFLEALGVASQAPELTTAGAVHGTQVVEAGEPRGAVAGVDGLTTARPGVPLLVGFADCCPLVLYDPRVGAVALCHAGWRGTAGGIATKGVRALAERYGSRARDLICGIGPSICGDCYEVGPEVAARFDGAGTRAGRGGRWLLDVAEVNRLQLVSAGVDPARIHRHPACTRETGELASHRRDHDGRRCAAVVVLR